MISRLRGEVVTRSPNGIVLDVGGVGYLVNPTASARRKAEPGGEVVLETYMHVREDVLQLFGFAEPAERELFELLLSVQGVGPKVALAIVSGSAPNELRRAIAFEDTARFQAIPGIGKKTAERVVLELKEKLGSIGETEEAGATPLSPKPHLVARDALVELGYSLVEAEEALAGTDPEAPPEERVREALKKAA
jgi:Holliday junction DNA helicase RuvA